MTNIFDTHAHYSSRQFDADRAALLKALPAGGVVGVLECATHSGWMPMAAWKYGALCAIRHHT